MSDSKIDVGDGYVTITTNQMTTTWRRGTDEAICYHITMLKQEIERLQAKIERLKQINRQRFISSMTFGTLIDNKYKEEGHCYECVLCRATSDGEVDSIKHEIDCPLRGYDDE